MTKTTKSIRIDDALWKEVKIHVAQTDDDISSFIEDSIRDKLKKKK
jgi:predicted transcriptional regulator